MAFSSQQQHVSGQVGPMVTTTTPSKGEFFTLPGELRLEIYESMMCVTPEDPQPLPRSHCRMRPCQILSVVLKRTRLVSKQFGREFAHAYYKRTTITLCMDLGDALRAIHSHDFSAGGCAPPLGGDYELIRKMEICVYLDNGHPTTCLWYFWNEAKPHLFPLLQQDSLSDTEEGGGERSQAPCRAPPVLLPSSLDSLHLRFISRGPVGYYIAREVQIAQVIESFATRAAVGSRLPEQQQRRKTRMTMEFFTSQSVRNAAAEHMFMRGHSVQEVGEAVGRPLWFQCDPPLKLGGSVQRWIDGGVRYPEIVRRVAQMQMGAPKGGGMARTYRNREVIERGCIGVGAAGSLRSSFWKCGAVRSWRIVESKGLC